MILHVFNADNDMALANGEPGYTPPASIQRMMRNTALLPTHWAKPGDGVLTEEGVWMVEQPAPRTENWSESIDAGKGHLVELSSVLSLITEVRPWGWSPAVCHRLRVLGIADNLLPSQAQLTEIRRLSSRERAVELLPRLTRTDSRLQGESVFCRTIEEVDAALVRWPRTILKAPWSGSGRGIRYGQGGREDTLRAWCSRIIQSQGGVVIEPFYDKRHDFAMEFWSDGKGEVSYCGLSVFSTHPNGAYAGNRLWSEEQKKEWLSSQVDVQLINLLQHTCQEQLSTLIQCAYRGPLGVDMMILANGCIHPCVEINLRMTMGYVAILC